VIGQTISHYCIIEKLGRGGMGEVYLAEDKQLGRKVAIKFLPREVATDERAKQRLLREAQTAATLDHPNICAIYEVGQEGDHSFIVLQYIEGETLASRLKRHLPDLREALAISAQVADALNEAHARGIIHRDIKPDNIMLTTRDQVKVLDFGLAKVLRDSSIMEADTATMLSIPGMVMGTVPYMSPEQVRGEALDCRSDIFSFGTVLYELLSGRRPFEAKSSAEVIAAILTAEPPPISRSSLGHSGSAEEALIRKCLEKDAALRYQTMGDLIPDLQQISREYESGQFTPQAKRAGLRPKPAITGPEGSRFRVSKLGLGLIVPSIVVALAAGVYVYSSRTVKRPLGSGAAIMTANSAAYDAYMRGMVVVSSENPADNQAAIKLFELAVAADPNFASAYAELSRAYTIKARYVASDADRKKSYEDAEVAVDKALAIDTNLAEGHFARGLMLWTPYKRFPHAQAIQSYRRAIELNPNFDEAHHQLGFVYLHIGMLDKAQQEIEKALAINPGNTLARYRLGVIDMCRAKYAEAFQIFNSTPLGQNPELLAFYTSNALFRLGRNDEASALIERYFKDYSKDKGGMVTSVKAMMSAKAGKNSEAEATIQHAIEIGRGYAHFHHTSYNIASAYSLMNKPEQAMKWLQVTADEGFPNYPLFEGDAQLDNLRKDPRFIAFMAQQKRQWEQFVATL
jgi:tetratricopeptide (TPR) repeat protein/tRNA A-37 threonylcarbamoyl transferase component Bud32